MKETSYLRPRVSSYFPTSALRINLWKAPEDETHQEIINENEDWRKSRRRKKEFRTERKREVEVERLERFGTRSEIKWAESY